MTMKLCIDPGHGMLNASPQRYDPGAVFQAHEEASLVLDYAILLWAACAASGIDAVLTRRKRDEPMPLQRRVEFALEKGCTTMLSLHANAAGNLQAHGTETLYRRDATFAALMQQAAVSALGLRDRGIKPRPGLAVLKFPGPCALIELGFITNNDDRAVMMSKRTQFRFAQAVAKALTQGGWE